jgi:hypothetical protein
MSQLPMQRNKLVDFNENNNTPAPPGVGVAIKLASQPGQGRFPIGAPVFLHGAYSADAALIRQCPQGLTASILLTLIRTDKVWGETAPLISPEARVQRPLSDTPPSLSYRERGQFNVDLVKFFELPAERGEYRIEASFGPYLSERLRFSIE